MQINRRSTSLTAWPGQGAKGPRGRCIVGLLATTIACAPLAGAQDAAQYHVVKTLTFDSAGSDFMTVDEDGRRLYGVGSVVIDIDSGAVVGHVPPHTGWGIVFDRKLGVAVGRRGVIFDTHSLTSLGHIDVVRDGIAYDQPTHRAFLFGDTTTVIDLEKKAVVGTVTLNDGYSIAVESGVSDGAGNVYLNNHLFRDQNDSNGVGRIAVIDVRSLKVKKEWVYPSCIAPEAMAYDKRRGRLFVGCLHLINVVDLHSGDVVATIPFAGHVNQFAYDAAHHTLFCPDAQGHIVLVREKGPKAYEASTSIDIPEGGSSVAFDSRSGRLFTFKRKNQNLTVDLLIIAPTTQSAAASRAGSP